MKYIFGPVNSRRLGISLGIDLVEQKTCNLNCVYCEIGKTTKLTNEIKEYIIADKIIEELNSFLKSNPKLDYITFSGMGEPTLNSKINYIIDYLKENYSQYKICLITNSILLNQENYKLAFRKIDILIPSLDSISQDVFEKINRPYKGILAKDILKNLIEFKKNFSVEMWLEIFFVPGINDNSEEINLLLEAARKIKPDKIQLNCLDRPSTEKWVKPMSQTEMLKIKEKFSDFFECQIIVRPNKANVVLENNKINENILDLISRRPLTIGELASIINLNKFDLENKLNDLEKNKIIKKIKIENNIFYKKD